MAILHKLIALTLLATSKLVAAGCNNKSQPPAKAADVAAAISQLVQQGGTCGPIGYGSHLKLAEVGSAQIVGVNPGVVQGSVSAPCAKVAEAVGLIMDECTTNDIVNGQTVSGQHTVPGNDGFNIIAFRIDG